MVKFNSSLIKPSSSLGIDGKLHPTALCDAIINPCPKLCAVSADDNNFGPPPLIPLPPIYEELTVVGSEDQILQIEIATHPGEPVNAFFGWMQGTAVTIIPTPYQQGLTWFSSANNEQGPFEYEDRLFQVPWFSIYLVPLGYLSCVSIFFGFFIYSFSSVPLSTFCTSLPHQTVAIIWR